MRKQHGMTLIGMLFTVAVVICAGIIVLRVVPVYLQHYEVMSSVSALSTLPSSDFSADSAANAGILRSKLRNQLYVNGVDSVDADKVIITPNGDNNFQISLKYQVVRPLFGNVSLLFDFSETKEVKISAE